MKYISKKQLLLIRAIKAQLATCWTDCALMMSEMMRL